MAEHLPDQSRRTSYEAPFSLETYRAVVRGCRCVCGNDEAEDDRSAVLRCPVHGIVGAASDDERTP